MGSEILDAFGYVKTISKQEVTLIGMIHIWRPWKLSSFKDPSPPFFINVQNSTILLTLDFQFQTNPLSPNDNQSIKRKHNPGWLLYVISSFLQVGYRFQCQLINLLWLFFNFFSFSWSLTIRFFVALYSCVCDCPKISRNIFYLSGA